MADFKIPQLDEFSLQITVHIKPSDVDEFFALFKPVFDEVVKLPELLYIEVFQDPDDPGTLSWVENWKQSVEWMMTVQIRKEYYKEYLEKTEAMFVKPREFKISKRVKGHYIVQRNENRET